jgi:hypothetical protein
MVNSLLVVVSAVKTVLLLMLSVAVMGLSSKEFTLMVLAFISTWQQRIPRFYSSIDDDVFISLYPIEDVINLFPRALLLQFWV